MSEVIPAEVVEAAAVAIFQNQTGMDWESRSDVLKETVRGDARAALEAAAPYMLAASAAKLRGWYDERMSEEPAPDVTLTDYQYGREVGTTEGILAAALLMEAETKCPPLIRAWTNKHKQRGTK